MAHFHLPAFTFAAAALASAFASMGCSSPATGTPTASSDAPRKDVAACDASSAPTAYHLEVGDAAGTRASMQLAAPAHVGEPMLAAVADSPGSALTIALHPTACGAHAKVAYALTRVDFHDHTSPAGEALAADFGPIPGMTPDAPIATAIKALEAGIRVEGTLDVERGKESAFTEGTWNDGYTYFVRVTAL